MQSNDRVSRTQAYLLAAWLIAITATLGSLYSSEILNLPICHLCWYQRICIYPLSLILVIGAFRNDAAAVLYALPMTALGFIFALYQYLQQMIPGFAPIEVCGNGPHCDTIHVNLLGFITLPFLSMLAAALIAAILIMALISKK